MPAPNIVDPEQRERNRQMAVDMVKAGKNARDIIKVTGMSRMAIFRIKQRQFESRFNSTVEEIEKYLERNPMVDLHTYNVMSKTLRDFTSKLLREVAGVPENRSEFLARIATLQSRLDRTFAPTRELLGRNRMGGKFVQPHIRVLQPWRKR